jgi:hypothetical protein
MEVGRVMAYRLWIIEEAHTGRPIRAWLKAADPDAHEGRGAAEFTRDRTAARAFPDMRAALACWKAQSRVQPVRDDGKPNRPLTAYSAQPVADGSEPL